MTAYDYHVLNHPDVLHYWKLDEASGTTLGDSAGAAPLTLSSEATAYNPVGGPFESGEISLTGLSATNTGIDLATVQAAGGVAFGGWFKNMTSCPGMGDWQSNSGAMMFAASRLYYNGTIASMAGNASLAYCQMLDEWHFIVATYDDAANSYRWRLWQNGVMEVDSTAGGGLGAGAGRFEVGTYATGGGGTGTIPGAHGLFILDAVPTDEWIEQASAFYTPAPYGPLNDYEEYVQTLEPDHFWSLQGHLNPLPNTINGNLLGAVDSYEPGPGMVAGDVAATRANLALNDNARADAARNSTAYTYGGWFKRLSGTGRVWGGNWDTDGTMIFNGSTAEGWAIYHESSINQIAPPEGFDANEWHHYAVRWDGTTQTFFIDGKAISSVARSGGLQSSLRMNWTGYNGHNGALHASAAYIGWWENVALSDEELRHLATGPPNLWSTEGSRSPMVMG